MTATYDDNDRESWHSFVLSRPTADKSAIHDDVIPDDKSRKRNGKDANRKRRRSSTDKHDVRTADRHDECAEMLQHLVDAIQERIEQLGGTGCRVTGRVKTSHGKEVIMCQNDGARQCLVTKGEVHRSNNAYLTKSGEFEFTYRCHSEACRGRSYPLGKIAGCRKSQKTDDGMEIDANGGIDTSNYCERGDEGSGSLGEDQGGDRIGSDPGEASGDEGSDSDDEGSDSDNEGSGSDDEGSGGDDEGSGSHDEGSGSQGQSGDDDPDESGDEHSGSLDEGMLSPYVRWQVRSEAPENSVRIENEALTEALKQKQVFDRDECRQFQLSDCSVDPFGCYIEGDGKYFTPIGPKYDYNVPDAQVSDLLSALPPSHKKRDKITAVCKKFGYWKQWRQWSSGIDSGADWRDADTECEEDLDYIVKLVNDSRRKTAKERDHQAVKVPKIEKIYFREPVLSHASVERVTRRLNAQYIQPEELDTKHRVSVIKSCTGSGKTQATIGFARSKGMPLLSVCCRISQVQEHCKTFKRALPGRTVKYDDIEARRDFKPGVDNYITTVDSLHKIGDLLPETHYRKYIVYLDEIHSVIDHVLTSKTLDARRKDVISQLSKLIKNAAKVVCSDNEVSDRDLKYIDDMRRVVGGYKERIDFIVNGYKKYAGIPARHTHDAEELVERMQRNITDRKGFTCACNTKKRAEELAMRLRQNCPSDASRIKCLTSDQGHFDAENVDSDWQGSGVIYSPTITTGVDFNPEVPQTVYLYVDGEHTVSPHTALQMIARNRNIEKLYICSTGMRNRPTWSTRHDFATSIDSLKNSLESMHVLNNLRDSSFNECEGTYGYSENSFSELYKMDQWNDNMMRSSYMYNLDRLLQDRGFKVIRPGFRKKLEEMREQCNWAPIRELVEHERQEQFKLYLKNNLADSGKLTECLDRRLDTLRRTKEELLALIDANPAYEASITEVCTDARSFEHNKNLVLALYTDEKLRRAYDYEGTTNYDMNRQHAPTAKCLLLRAMLAVMNRGMSVQLKTYDLTLSQTQYDEDEQVEVPDNIWKLYRYHMRTRKSEKPQTRKAWMMCVYLLAKDLFGARFIKRLETSRGGNRANGGVRCYNFQTDKSVVDLAIDLIDWRQWDLESFEPEVVQKYDLERLKGQGPVQDSMR